VTQERLKRLSVRIKGELAFFRLLLKHPETPLSAKLLLALAIGYVLLPFDLIPDWIPALGYLDDLVIVPALVMVALKLTPKHVMQDCRMQVSEMTERERPEKQISWFLPSAAIVALVLLVGIPSLFTRDLWNPDEPRYMEVAREMVAMRDYVIPHLNGQVYSEKPPLFFWLAGLLWRAGFGYNSGRVATLLAVCGTLLLIYAFCRPRIGPSASLLAPAIALTSLLLFRFSTIGVLDPLIMFLTTAALLSGYCAFHRKGRSALLWWLGCYLAMGLATLTKGPVGFIIPGLVLLPYGILNRKSIKAGGAAHAIGFAAFLAVVLAWLIPAILAGGPEYTRTILLKQNVGRAITSFSHRNPFYYYLLRWPAYFFPWSFILPLAVVAVVRRWRDVDNALRLSALWLFVPFVFLSFISGKRMNYVVPAVPAAGVLCAWYLALRPASKGRLLRAERWLFRASFVSVAVMTILLMAAVLLGPALVAMVYPEGQFSHEIAQFLSPSRQALALAALALPLVVCLWGLFRAPASSLGKAATLVAAVLLISPGMDFFAVPAVNLVKSGRHFGATINRYATPGRALYFYGDEFSGVYNLWTGRVSIPELRSKHSLYEKLADADSLIVSDLKRFRRALSPAQLERYRIAQERIGHRVMLILDAGRPPPGAARPSEAQDAPAAK